MKIKLDEGAYPMERAHPTDAGLDIRTPKKFYIGPYGHRVIHTGIHVQLPPGTCGLLVSKSGLNTKHNVISTGLIDEGYTGEILVKLYRLSDDVLCFERGDKISQLVIMPCIYEDIEIVEEITGGPRGDNGFGSTGV